MNRTKKAKSCLPFLIKLKENLPILCALLFSTSTTLSYAFSVDYLPLIDRFLSSALPKKEHTVKANFPAPPDNLQSPFDSPELDPAVKDTIAQIESQTMTNASYALETATQRNEAPMRAPESPLTGIASPQPTMKTPGPVQPLPLQENAFASPTIGLPPVDRKPASAMDFTNLPDPAKPQVIPGAPVPPQDSFAPSPPKVNSARMPEPVAQKMPPGFSGQTWGAR